MRPGMNKGKKIGLIFLGIAFFAAVIFVTQSLWNWLVPDLFHGPVISYWQALGLLVLGKLLFGWHNHHRGGWGGWGRREWKEKIRERMAGMTPEQREKMREHLRNHCGSRRFGWQRGEEEFDRFANWRDTPDDKTSANKDSL